MIYILKFTTGGQVEINEDEYQAILKADDNQSIGISRLGIMVQKRMIQVFPKPIADSLENKKELQVGMLHDGTMVKRYFGTWVLYSGEAPDDNGNYKPIKIDSSYYPEVAADCVLSLKEYEDIKHLPEKERLALMTKKYPRIGKIKSEPERIKFIK